MPFQEKLKNYFRKKLGEKRVLALKKRFQAASEFYNREKMSSEELFRREMRQIIGPCLICKQELAGHRLANLATHAVDPSLQHDAQLEHFLNLLKNHQWSEAIKISNFNPSQDDVSADILSCPQGPYALCYFRDPFELFDATHLIEYDLIPDKSLPSLLPLLESKWKSL